MRPEACERTNLHVQRSSTGAYCAGSLQDHTVHSAGIFSPVLMRIWKTLNIFWDTFSTFYSVLSNVCNWYLQLVNIHLVPTVIGDKNSRSQPSLKPAGFSEGGNVEIVMYAHYDSDAMKGKENQLSQ